MRRILFALLITGCALSAFAQSSRTDPKRMASIWLAAKIRIKEQVDIWFDRGDYPRSIQALRFLANYEPDNYEAQTDLGWMLENVDKYDEALAVYIHYRKEFPNLPDSAFPEANFYFMHKAYVKVPPLLEPTLAGKPHPDSFRLLAHAYDRLGLLADSKRTWEALIAWHPDDLAAKANLAKVEKKISRQTNVGS